VERSLRLSLWLQVRPLLTPQVQRHPLQVARSTFQEESNMPKVGNKKFAYTAKGKAAAKKEAKKTGKAMQMKTYNEISKGAKGKKAK
jgi:hypothetical protein